jgi:hypothetical protein
MWEQLKSGLEASARAAGRLVAEAATLIGRVLLIGWELVRPAVVLALNILVALILIFEEWGWRPLSALVARLARFRLWAMAELWIAGLPPYGALLALGVPSAILIPAKLLGVYLLATGHFITAAMVIVAAKFASTALIARIFLLTKPALMQMPWFAYAYDVFVPWQEALFARIRNSWAWRYGRILKWRAKQYARGIWSSVRPQLEAGWRAIRPRLRGAWFRMRTVTRDLLTRVSPARRSPPRQLPPPDPRRR